jgi:hypothetical protein
MGDWKPKLGDLVHVKQFVADVGYEKSILDLRDEVKEEARKQRLKLPGTDIVASCDRDWVQEQVFRKLRAMDGAERKVFMDPAPVDPGKVFTVVGVKRKWTGTYRAAWEYGGYGEPADWDPPRLTNTRNVMLYEVKDKLHHAPSLVLLEDMEPAAGEES